MWLSRWLSLGVLYSMGMARRVVEGCPLLDPELV